MFTASSEFSFEVPVGLRTPGHSYFKAVELPAPLQWYVVGYAERHPGGWGLRTILVSWGNDLLPLLIATDRTETFSVQLVSPAADGNEGAPWKMMNVQRIFRAKWGATLDDAAIVYELEDGLRMVDPMEPVALHDLRSFQLIWAQRAVRT